MKKLILFSMLFFAYFLSEAQFTFKDGGGTVDVYTNGTLKTSFQKAGLTVTYAGNVMTLRQDTKRSFTYKLNEIDTPAYSTIDSVVSVISGWLSTYGGSSYWKNTDNYLYPKTISDSVGIGTSTPSLNLEVSGNSLFDGYINVTDSLGINSEYVSGFTYLDSITSNIGNVVTGVPNAYIDTVSASYLILNNDSISYRKGVAKFHRIDSLNTSSANTWITVKMDTMVGDESTYGFKFNADSSAIICTQAGIIQVGGCVHYHFYGGSTTLAKLYTRVLIDGQEARCLQTNTNKNRFANATGYQNYIGSVTANEGSTIQLQIQVDNTDLDLQGDAVFDHPVAATIWFNYLSK